jgi:hypothetical protein
MPKETITISRQIETVVYCDKCGQGLCSQSFDEGKAEGEEL